MDDKMEITQEDKDTLMQLETVKTQGKPEDDTIEFDKVKLESLGPKKDEYRRVPVPRNRITPLKQQWDSILKTLVEHMKLQVRMNTKKRCIELKVKKTVPLSQNPVITKQKPYRCSIFVYRQVRLQSTLVRFRKLPISLKLSCLVSNFKTLLPFCV